MHELFGDPISTYSRAQAIEDGALVDVSEMAKEAGFKFPTCVSQAVWADIQKGLARGGSGQDEKGRLWDVLWMAFLAARRSAGRDRVNFVVKIGRQNRHYYLHCGPGDTPAPVLTILHQGED